MRYALMIAALFLIATIAVASLEPFAPSLPTASQKSSAAGQDGQVADGGDAAAPTDDSAGSSPMSSASSYDESAQDRGK